MYVCVLGRKPGSQQKKIYIYDMCREKRAGVLGIPFCRLSALGKLKRRALKHLYHRSSFHPSLIESLSAVKAIRVFRYSYKTYIQCVVNVSYNASMMVLCRDLMKYA